MDRVIASWRAAGRLAPNPDLKFAMAMFLVPKPDGGVHHRLIIPTALWGLIIDYSPWTEFIVTPEFSLKLAAAAVREIPPGALMVKIDLNVPGLYAL